MESPSKVTNLTCPVKEQRAAGRSGRPNCGAGAEWGRIAAMLKAVLRTRRGPGVALAAILLAHLVVNAAWIQQDLTLRAMDMGCHLGVAARFYAEVKHDGLLGLLFALRGDLGTNWPAAGYLPWAAAAGLAGSSITALRLFNLIFLAALLVGVYHVGRRLHRPWTGALAAAVCSLYPGIYGASRQFGADLPAAAAVAVAVALLLATERFGRPRASLWLGVAVGAGVLLRPLSVLAVGPPALAALALGLWRPGGVSRGRRMLGFALCGAAALAVSAVWWAGRLGQIADAFVSHASGGFADIGGERGGALHYLVRLPDAAGVVLLLAAGAALVALALWGWRRRGADGGDPPGPDLTTLGLVAVWLLAGMAVISLIGHRFTRYVFPMLPALALLTSAGLGVIRRAALRRLLVAAALAASGVSLLVCSFNWGAAPQVLRPGPLPSSSCKQCGDWSYGGPPAVDGFHAAARRVARAIQNAHGEGHDVLVQVRPGTNLHGTVLTKAVLATALPGATLTALGWEGYAAGHGRRVINISAGAQGGVIDDLYLPIMGVPYAGPHRAVRHCYVLRLDGVVGARPAGALTDLPAGITARRLLTADATSFSGPLRFELWRLSACPLGAQLRRIGR